MGPRALTAYVGARPVEHGCGSVLRQRKRKIQPLKGVKGACPLMLPPPLGERGGHRRNFHAISKNPRGFLQKRIFLKYGNLMGKYDIIHE